MKGEIKLDTKTIMTNAIYQLLQETSSDKITVDMILNKAGLSRATFYRHFKDKYDAMNWYYQKNVDKILQEKNGPNFDLLLLKGLNFISDNKAYVANILKMEGLNSFPDFLYHYTFDFYKREYLRHKGTKSLNIEERISMEYYSNAVLFIIKTWAARGFQEPSEMICEIILKIMPEFMRPYF
ncbi:MAG: TetR/AcrR family transcriptional regulator C-terminal domain-containing protein [Syntrophomonadaceae bacterium]|nr:TetR/AcrR family transcriptional regulator C-terminal domain-containing protein [Syntrophomonadaceae bacterium]